MKLLIALLTAFLAVPFCATAQKEDYVWIFAENRIDFNTAPPTVTQCAVSYQTKSNITSVCDRDGNLMYWLNGTDLYNKNDEVIFSLTDDETDIYFYGLSIVPFPDRENVYLFIYPNPKRGRLIVSLVDGSEDLLKPKITESYKEFPHIPQYGSGIGFFFQKFGSRDFWMLYDYNGKIRVYALTKDGFLDTGREYTLPKDGENTIYLDGGEMTPDRSKILATSYSYGPQVFIDLDNKTGEIKNINLIDPFQMHAFAFSSGNKYLYYTWNDKGEYLFRVPVNKLSDPAISSDLESFSELIAELPYTIGDIKYVSGGGMCFTPQDGDEYLAFIEDCDSEHPVLNFKWLKLAKNSREHKAPLSLFFPKTYCYPSMTEDNCGGMSKPVIIAE